MIYFTINSLHDTIREFISNNDLEGLSNKTELVQIKYIRYNYMGSDNRFEIFAWLDDTVVLLVVFTTNGISYYVSKDGGNNWITLWRFEKI